MAGTLRTRKAHPAFDVDKMNEADFSYLRANEVVWDDKLIDRKNLSRIRLSHPDSWNKLCPSTYLKLGNFDKLSTELLYMLFGHLDLTTLFLLRQTNSHVKGLIEQWRPFREIMTFGPDSVRAMLATGVSRFRTATDLQAVVFTTRCEFCGEHGEILQLLKFARCCFRCLSTDRRLLAVDVDFVVQAMNVNVQDESVLRKIPHLLAPHQADHWGQPQVRNNLWLFDYNAALQFAQNNTNLQDNNHSTFAQRSSLLPTILWKRTQAGNGKSEYLGFPRLNFHTEISPPESHPQRFLSAIYCIPIEKIYPWTHGKLYAEAQPCKFKFALTAPAKAVGVYPSSCAGCRHYWNLISPHHHLTHTIYTDSEFRDHLKTCTYARLYWEKLYDPAIPADDPSSADNELIIRTLVHKPLFHFPRHEKDRIANNRNFEKLPIRAMGWLERNGNGYQNLYGDMNRNWDGWAWDDDREAWLAPHVYRLADHDDDDGNDEDDYYSGPQRETWDELPTYPTNNPLLDDWLLSNNLVNPDATTTTNNNSPSPATQISLKGVKGIIYSDRTGRGRACAQAFAISTVLPHQLETTGPVSERRKDILETRVNFRLDRCGVHGRVIPRISRCDTIWYRTRAKKPTSPPETVDWYFDSLLGDDASSQATWCTASVNSTFFLNLWENAGWGAPGRPTCPDNTFLGGFGNPYFPRGTGYVGLLRTKYRRHKRRIEADGMRMEPFWAWGFDRL